MRHFTSPLLALTAVLGSAVLLPSCKPFLFIDPPMTPWDHQGVFQQTFLFSKYQPLNAFLDTPVYVHIDDVPLDNVFDHPALRPLKYSFVQKPKYEKGLIPRVTIHQVALTRRQLLWAIAQDYNLEMHPIINPNGQCYIDIQAEKTPD
jgi:hypothetical protein